MRFIPIIALLLPVAASSVQSHVAPLERQLKAARSNRRLASRSTIDLVRKGFELEYIDDQVWRPDAMGAQMVLHHEGHNLVLEDAEPMLEEVECPSPNSLAIRFAPEFYSSAREKITSKMSNLFIITSHAGCNQPGTRMPYKALSCSSHNDNRTLKFSLEETSWKKLGMKLHFGPADRHAYTFNRHDHLLPISKRGIAAASIQPSLSTVSVSTTSTIPSQSSVQFPTPSGPVNSSNTNTTDSIAFSLQNTKIIPPSLDNITLGIPFHDTGLTVTCTNCSTTGSVSLMSGYFSAGKNTSNHFLSDGFIELAANDMTAHIDLDLNWLASAGESIPIALGKIPLTPFTIPGVANVGATFIPQILLNVATPVDMDFQYGFDVHVPNNSTAVASFGNSNKSAVTGFENATITALPFSAQVNNVSLTLTATLQPQVLLGLTVLEENAGAAVFINLPQLAISVTEVTNTNDRCEPSNTTADASQVNKMLGNLTHVVPQVELAAGFVVEASGVGQTAYTPFATTFALETACLAFNSHGSSYLPATAAFASATASSASAATAAKTSSAGTQVNLKFDGIHYSVKQWQWACVALAIVFGTFATF